MFELCYVSRAVLKHTISNIATKKLGGRSSRALIYVLIPAKENAPLPRGVFNVQLFYVLAEDGLDAPQACRRDAGAGRDGYT